MKELELNHLAPYLPYGLKLMNKYSLTPETLISCDDVYATLFGLYKTVSEQYSYDEIKPILYPLDYLTKEITHNGETFVPIEFIEDKYFTLNYVERLERCIEDSRYLVHLDYLLITHLIEWRFDIFNLIEDGLAIPVTEDFNPYI